MEKKIVLSEVKNQYGELVDEEFLIYQGGGRWDSYSLQCYSSSDLGLGTCRCVSHSPYHYNGTIGVKEMKKILEENPILVSQLTDEEREAIELYNREFSTRIINDILVEMELSSVEELLQCLANCYKLGVNPLPRLREVLRELGYDNVEVIYAIAQDYALPPEPEGGKVYLVIWHHVDDNEVYYEIVE